MNPDPFISLASDIEESSTITDVSDLLVLMQVLIEEHLDLFLVDIAHLLWGNGDYIAVLVASLQSKLIDICLVGESVVENAKLREVLGGYIATGIMELALVTLRVVSDYTQTSKSLVFHTAPLSYQ